MTAPDVPAREGFIFDSWDIDFSSVTEDMTITARWTKVTANVAFDANGASKTMDPVSMTTGDEVPACGFTAPEDKEFKEWNTKQDAAAGY